MPEISPEEITRLQEGEQWAASMGARIMAAAIGGLADAAIITNQKFNLVHALAAVKQLADEANQLRTHLDDARQMLLAIENWEMPPSGQTLPNGEAISYGNAFGSNGERTHIQLQATRALTKIGRPWPPGPEHK